ncbi:MAG: hypothetical protein RLZZ156_25, partial [Deinococcota bacterium]
MSFSHHDFSSQLARLWSHNATLELSAPLEGVIRARFAPMARVSSLTSPLLPPKDSFAVIHQGSLP